jgi:hypothetical protein
VNNRQDLETGFFEAICMISAHARMMCALHLSETLKRQSISIVITMLPDTNLTQKVKRLFVDAEGALRVGEIYDAVEENYPLSVNQKEFTRYHEPRFHHEIRAIINQLMQNGEIIRVERGKYKKA